MFGSEYCVALYGMCGSRISRSFTRRAAEVKNRNAGPISPLIPMGKRGYLAALCDPDC